MVDELVDFLTDIWSDQLTVQQNPTLGVQSTVDILQFWLFVSFRQQRHRSNRHVVLLLLSSYKKCSH